MPSLGEKVAAVLRDRGFDIIIQTEFGLEWRKIRHMLMKKNRNGDAFLCLVGTLQHYPSSDWNSHWRR